MHSEKETFDFFEKAFKNFWELKAFQMKQVNIKECHGFDLVSTNTYI